MISNLALNLIKEGEASNDQIHVIRGRTENISIAIFCLMSKEKESVIGNLFWIKSFEHAGGPLRQVLSVIPLRRHFLPN